MINDISFNYMDYNGNNKKYIIVDKFNLNDKNYLLYKEEENDNLYASFYEVIDDKIKIIPIENDKDYDIVDKYLEGK